MRDQDDPSAGEAWPEVRAGAVGLLDRAVAALGILAGVVAATMMAVTVVDVLGRNLFNAPLFGAFEITEIAMVSIVFLALPFVTWTRTHLSVSVFYGLYPPRVQALVTGLGDLVFGAVCALVAWRAWLYAERLFRVRETTLELQIPRGVIPAGVSVALWLTAALFLLLALRALLRGERAPT